MAYSLEPPGIPAPFDDLCRPREESNQSKWLYPLERQLEERDMRAIRRDTGGHRLDDLAAADNIAANPRRHGIPVDERKRHTKVVEGDPRSAAGFGRAE
jgi:hypothetical protein